MFFRKKPVFIGFHFAKTGGTSIKSHALANLADNESLSYGPFALADSFFACRPLLCEMSARQTSRFRFVFGHGVKAQILPHFAGRDISLFVTCRDPLRRFTSSLKHNIRTEQRFGEVVSARQVFEAQPANPFSSSILRNFGAMVPKSVRDPKERLVTILRCFRFVMSTDDLNEQSKPLFAALDAPPMTESKRVYPESVDLGDLTEAEILARDHLDAFVNRTINAFHADRGDAASAEGGNPFGFDQALLAQRVKALVKAAPARGEDIEATYRDLFNFLDKQGRLEAAKVLIDSGRQTRRVVEIFERYCREIDRSFDDRDVPSRSLCYQAEVSIRLGDLASASEYARRAVEADPKNPMAHYLTGRAALEKGQYEACISSLEHAAELNPNHAPSFRFLARAYQKVGRKADAEDALKAVKAL